MSKAVHRRSGALGYLSPALVVLTVWVYGPLVFTVVLSVLHWDGTGTPGFAGLDNYASLVADRQFPMAMVRTLLLVACLLPFATAVPMGLAITLWKRPGRAASTYRALLFVPVVLAPIANAVSWQFVLNPLGGVLNETLGLLGIRPVNWLGDPRTALVAIALITAGKIIGLNVLLYGAALDGLDPQSLDAARIDGAGERQVTRLVVVPQLWPVTGLLAGICVMLGGQWAFANVSVLTQGGPDGATDNIYYLLYTYGFMFFDTGQASAAAVVLITVLGAPLAARRLCRRAVAVNS
ncbi:ABC transporter permease subunit [Actinomadura sp. NPDC000600]|uniref:carbohydrate ABC transporter permease n=1 Tax=Actinomadura sp. NPDC000600 TaxID=3154262 RepID=UPI003396EAF1